MAYKDLSVLGIIPARGGSKGIPRKNIKDLAGKPLIAWSIDAAAQSEYIDRCIVSTDDDEIAEVAEACGGDVPFRRPKDISGDLATDVEFIEHTLTWLREQGEALPDIILRLPPTSPLRTAAHIDEGIRTLVDTPDADAARPIVEAPKHPYKFWRIEEGDPFLKPFLDEEHTGFKEPQNLPRQLFPKVYMHTGAMDVMWRRTIEEQHSTSGKKLAYFFMTHEDSANIDEPIDFLIAETIMRERNRAT